VLSAPPNRSYVINPDTPNPPVLPFAVVGGGVTPRTGLRVGAAYGTGRYAASTELRQPAARGRDLQMVSIEGEFAFGYTKITGEVTRDSIEMATRSTTALAWFLQGTETLSPRWFAATRIEGANAPPRQLGAARPTLRMFDVTLGFRASADLTLRGAYTTRKSYFSSATSRQAGVSLVWARRWW
jgi:hypothetical protein